MWTKLLARWLVWSQIDTTRSAIGDQHPKDGHFGFGPEVDHLTPVLQTGGLVGGGVGVPCAVRTVERVGRLLPSGPNELRPPPAEEVRGGLVSIQQNLQTTPEGGAFTRSVFP